MELHGPDVLSTIQLPMEYIPNRNFYSQYHGGAFDKYINHFLGGDNSQIQLILEFLGMALSNVQAHKFKKALLIIGSGNTGKSQLLRLVEMLLGTENTYFCGLNKLENSRFEISNLYGKRLGGTADMGFAKMGELETFKKLTGGDSVNAEFKGRKGFNFIFNGLMWFCSNTYPRFGGDKGEHVYKRFTIVRAVGQTYEKGSMPIAGAVEQDKSLLNKMYNERHYIVYLAINALVIALVNERYSETDKQKQELQRFEKSNSSMSAFFEDCICERIDRVLSDNCTKPMLLNIYKQWVIDNYGKQNLNRNEFYSFIKSQGGEVKIKDL